MSGLPESDMAGPVSAPASAPITQRMVVWRRSLTLLGISRTEDHCASHETNEAHVGKRSITRMIATRAPMFSTFSPSPLWHAHTSPAFAVKLVAVPLLHSQFALGAMADAIVCLKGRRFGLRLIHEVAHRYALVTGDHRVTFAVLYDPHAGSDLSALDRPKWLGLSMTRHDDRRAGSDT